MRVEAAGMQAEAVGIQTKAEDAAGELNPAYSWRLQLAAIEIAIHARDTSSLISLGQTASHSPMLAQLPNNLRLAAQPSSWYSHAAT